MNHASSALTSKAGGAGGEVAHEGARAGCAGTKLRTMRELWSRRDEDSLERFRKAIEEDDLVGGLFAIEGVTPQSAARGRELLREWGSRVRATTSLTQPPLLQARALQGVLGGELGFRGDADGYHHPKNSLLREVLTRRRGMPILLSCVWMEAGREAGLFVQGIGMPGHFIARVGPPPLGQLVDPFAGGRLLTERDCRLKVHELSGGKLEWRDEFLRRSRTDEIFERVLSNLAVGFEQEEDGPGCYRAAMFLAALRPESAEKQLKAASLADELGAHDVAHRIYEHLVDTFPETPECETAFERLEQGSRGLAVN